MNKKLVVFSIAIVIVCVSMMLGYEKLIVSPIREVNKELTSRVLELENELAVAKSKLDNFESQTPETQASKTVPQTNASPASPETASKKGATVTQVTRSFKNNIPLDGTYLASFHVNLNEGVVDLAKVQIYSNPITWQIDTLPPGEYSGFYIIWKNTDNKSQMIETSESFTFQIK